MGIKRLRRSRIGGLARTSAAAMALSMSCPRCSEFGGDLVERRGRPAEARAAALWSAVSPGSSQH